MSHLSVFLPPLWSPAKLCFPWYSLGGFLDLLWTTCGQFRLWAGPTIICAWPHRLVSVVGILIVHSCIPQMQSLSSWSWGFNLWLVQLHEKIFIPLPYSLNSWALAKALAPPLHVGLPQRSAPEASPKHSGLTWWGQGMEVIWLLGHRRPGKDRCIGDYWLQEILSSQWGGAQGIQWPAVQEIQL